MSIKVGSIDKGIYLLYKNDPHLVVDREFVSPGKGSAFARLRLKNIKTGALLKDVTLKTNETVEEASVTESKAQYLYFEGESYYFMDVNSYEQYEINAKGFENKKFYMEEGENINVVFWENTPIDMILPRKKVLLVEDAPESVKGDTATSVTKIVRCSTGLEVRTPAFIKEGEKILVNTDTGEYLERVNDK